MTNTANQTLPDATAERIRELERENARLRQRLARHGLDPDPAPDPDPDHDPDTDPGLSPPLDREAGPDQPEASAPRKRPETGDPDYRALVEELQEGIWAVDAEARTTFVNRRMAEMLGYAPEEMLGRPLFDFMEGRWQEICRANLAERRLGRSGQQDFEFRRRDGTPLYARVAVSPVFDASGNYLGTRAGIMDMSEARDAADALEQSERRYRTFFENSPTGIYFYRLDDKDRLELVDGNPAAEQITGVPLSSLLGLGFAEAFPGLEKIHRKFKEIAREGGVFRQERLPYRGPDFEGAFYVSAFQTAPNHMAVFFLDVSARSRLEGALRDSYEMLRHVMDGIPADVFVSDLESYEILFVNRRMRQRFGNGLEGRKCWEAFRNEPGPCEQCPGRRMAARGGETTCTWEDVNPVTGRRFLNQDTLIPWTDGRRAKLQVATDITDIRQTQQALAEAEQRYKRLFEGAAVGIFRTTPEGRFLTANPALARILGYDSPEEMVERVSSIGEQFYFDPEERRKFMEEALRDGAAERENRIRRRDGELIWVHQSMRVTREGPDGDTVFEGFISDVTERRKILARLAEAKERAEQASRAKSEFLANMSHEIRTPLNGVLGMLQLLQNSSLNEEQAEMVDVALGSGRSLLALLNDILSLSQVEAGRLVLREEDFELREVIAQVIDSLRPLADAKSLRLVSEVDPSVPCALRADAGRLRQVLFNLLGNALKFTDQGEIRVRAWLEERDDGPRLHLAVEDTGIGIPRDQLERIFESFTQVDGSHTRRYQGAGLGLAIVRRLVGLMDGEVRIESTVGRGTRALLHVRAHPAHDVPASSEAPTCPPPVAGSERLRVLLAEDDRVNRITAMRLLERLGYPARCVENGREALAALQEDDFDCVLMDVQMPGLDGVGATRRIRAGESGRNRPDIPIIALTAHAMEGDREAFLAAGMDGYLAKPVEMGELKRTLRRCCGLEQD